MFHVPTARTAGRYNTARRQPPRLSLFRRFREGCSIETNDGDGWIEVRGARTHNLKGVDLRIPRGRIVAFTGVSGSGKTSLAFDTIFAEGQRRYLEATAPSLRRVLD